MAVAGVLHQNGAKLMQRQRCVLAQCGWQSPIQALQRGLAPQSFQIVSLAAVNRLGIAEQLQTAGNADGDIRAQDLHSAALVIGKTA
ncbi:hypothetical protein JZU69_04010, partial [bacterium]|nr:hypothetical protein [bacterium]